MPDPATIPPRVPGPYTDSDLTADHTLITGATAPKLMYGTAWKKDRTADLVFQALEAGFRGIDTAAQPRHYREDLVGAGIRRAVAAGLVSRADLFLQTKYTPPPGQDPHDMPYDPALPVPDQVRASVASSLRNLAAAADDDDDGPPYLDCLVLHSPFPDPADTAAAWAAMAALVPHPVRALGVSNADLPALQLLWRLPHPPPAVVQNRFYPGAGYDAALRRRCAAAAAPRRPVFQAFWVLSGDGGRMRRRPCVRRLARAVPGGGVDPAAAQYALVLGLGAVTVLDGTADPSHMAADLEGLARLGAWIRDGGAAAAELWGRCLAEFREIVDADAEG